MTKTFKTPIYPPPFIYKIFERFRFFLVRFSQRLTIPGVVIIEQVQSFYVAKAIGVAASLNIAEHLKTGKLSVFELAKLTNTHEESLYRLMRMLASQGIFNEKEERVFSQNRLSKTFINNEDSMRHMIIHQANSINWKMFDEMEYSVQTGNSAASKVLGMDVFEYMEKNRKNNEVYKNAMSNTSTMLSYALLSVYSFKNATCVIDIGGGEGVLLSVILSKHKQLHGKVFDLPHVVNSAQSVLEKYGVSERTELISGDFNEQIPTGGDVYLMKSILHFMGDEPCIRLLKKIKEVLPQNGKILLIEPIVENHNRYSFAKLYDIQMMIGCTDGKERTKKEYTLLAKQAGLRLAKIKHTISPFSVIELLS